MEPIGASDQARQIDVQHVAEVRHTILAAPIERDPLRLDQDVEFCQARIGRFDSRDIRNVDLPVDQSCEVGAFFVGVVGRGSPRSPNMNLCAALTECLRSGVADPARAADDQSSLSGEIQLHDASISVCECGLRAPKQRALTIRPSL